MEKRGGDKSRASLDARVVRGEHFGLRNRPLSALILNLRGYHKITARFAMLIEFFAEPTKPRLRLE